MSNLNLSYIEEELSKSNLLISNINTKKDINNLLLTSIKRKKNLYLDYNIKTRSFYISNENNFFTDKIITNKLNMSKLFYEITVYKYGGDLSSCVKYNYLSEIKTNIFNDKFSYLKSAEIIGFDSNNTKFNTKAFNKNNNTRVVKYNNDNVIYFSEDLLKLLKEEFIYSIKVDLVEINNNKNDLNEININNKNDHNANYNNIQSDKNLIETSDEYIFNIDKGEINKSIIKELYLNIGCKNKMNRNNTGTGISSNKNSNINDMFCDSEKDVINYCKEEISYLGLSDIIAKGKVNQYTLQNRNEKTINDFKYEKNRKYDFNLLRTNKEDKSELSTKHSKNQYNKYSYINNIADKYRIKEKKDSYNKFINERISKLIYAKKAEEYLDSKFEFNKQFRDTKNKQFNLEAYDDNMFLKNEWGNGPIYSWNSNYKDLI